MDQLSQLSFGTSKSNSDSVGISPTSHFSSSNLISNGSPITKTSNLPSGLSIILVQETNPLHEGEEAAAKHIVFSPHFKIKHSSIFQTPGIDSVIPTDHENQIAADQVPMEMIFGPITAEEIILSEEYTCIKVLHGPNPKVTHIFGDCILKCHPFNIYGIPTTRTTTSEVVAPVSPQPAVMTSRPNPRFTNDFLKNCYACKKVHAEWSDVYIYRDASFCSEECRFEEMLADYRKVMMKVAKQSWKSSSSSSNNTAGINSSTSQDNRIFFLGEMSKYLL